MDDADQDAPDRPGHRIERDSLGEVRLGADAPWGASTQRTFESTSFSGRNLGTIHNLLHTILFLKVAAARVNHRAGILSAEVAEAIEAVATEMRVRGPAPGPDHRFPADVLAGGGAIAVHANVNEVIANLASERLGGSRGSYHPVTPQMVGASQSTADVMHTAARLTVDFHATMVWAVTGRLALEFEKQAERVGDLPTLARTCLQDALEVPARLLLDGSAAALYRAAASLKQALEPMTAIVLGSTVVGTGAGAPDGYGTAVVDELRTMGYRDVTPDPVPASRLQHVDDLLAVADAIDRLGAVAAKIARDVRMLSSGPRGGFGEVHLPAVMEGSSFIAGKVNPAVPESLIQAAAQVSGLRATAHAAAREGELHLHGHDLAIAVAVIDQAEMFSTATDRFRTHCVQGMEFDEERCRELASFARQAPQAQTGDDA